MGAECPYSPHPDINYFFFLLSSLFSILLEKARGAPLDWEKSHSSTPLFLLGQNFFTALFRLNCSREQTLSA